MKNGESVPKKQCLNEGTRENIDILRSKIHGKLQNNNLKETACSGRGVKSKRQHEIGDRRRKR